MSKPSKETLVDRVKINDNGCWIWQGAIKNPGKRSLPYGWITFRNKQMNAHRASWILSFGEIPNGVCVCHKCDVPLCVNPDHLFLGTHSDNMRDMWSKGRHKDPSDGITGSLSSKLDLSDIAQIRGMISDGIKQRDIAKAFAVSQSAISRINTGENWGRYA